MKTKHSFAFILSCTCPGGITAPYCPVKHKKIVEGPPVFQTTYFNPVRALPDQQDWYLCITQIHESSVIYISRLWDIPSTRLRMKIGEVEGISRQQTEKERRGSSGENKEVWAEIDGVGAEQQWGAWYL